MAAVKDTVDSGNAVIDALTANRVWATTSLQFFIGDNTALNLDPFFEQSFHRIYRGLPDKDFFFDEQLGRAYTALNAVSRLDITQTLDADEADMVVVSTSNNYLSDISGFHDFPGRTEFGTDNYRNLGAFNASHPTTAKPSIGGSGAIGDLVVLHEVGHSMGLLHSHDNHSGAPLPALGDLDSNRYTVMSYNAEAHSYKFGHPVGYMALDIAALQSLYGAEDYATGDSTYLLTFRDRGYLDLTEGATMIGRAWYSIWDTGGIDTVSFVGYGRLSSVINLNAATLDTTDTGEALGRVIETIRGTEFFASLSRQQRADMAQADRVAGGSFSYIVGETGGYSIANGAAIENATGGWGRDLLIGNALDNVLTGRGGADTLIGGDGNDTLNGGPGRDILIGGLGADVFVYSGGRDVIQDFNADEGDVLVGDWPVG